MDSGIPVTFECEGKICSGVLIRVSGGGSSSTFYLMVDNYYWGQLWFVDAVPAFDFAPAREAGWRFASNTKELAHLADYFGSIVISWYDSNS